MSRSILSFFLSCPSIRLFTRSKIPANLVIFFNKQFGKRFGMGLGQSMQNFVKTGEDLVKLWLWELKLRSFSGLSGSSVRQLQDCPVALSVVSQRTVRWLIGQFGGLQDCPVASIGQSGVLQDCPVEAIRLSHVGLGSSSFLRLAFFSVGVCARPSVGVS